jgi:hypothetical protein
MGVGGLWRGARRRWRALAAELWPSTPAEKTQEELARLEGELAILYARMLSLRRKIDACRGDAERAARLEALYERQRQRLERRKRLRRDLAAGRLEVVDVTFPN